MHEGVKERCSALQYNKIQCSALQYNGIECSALQYNRIQCSALQYNAKKVGEPLTIQTVEYMLGSAPTPAVAW